MSENGVNAQSETGLTVLRTGGGMDCVMKHVQRCHQSVSMFYGWKRQHSTFGYKSPMQFLDSLISQQGEKQVA